MLALDDVESEVGAHPAAHRILALLTLGCAVLEGVRAVLGLDPESLLAVLVLVAAGAGFIAADRLARRGRPGTAGRLTGVVLLALTPVVAVLYQPGVGAVLLPAIGFLVALPHLRGAVLVAFAAAGVILATIAAIVPRWAGTGAAGDPAAIRLLGSAVVGSAFVTALLFLLAWHGDRARSAAAARHRRLLAGLPVGVCRLDDGGRISAANDAFARMLGHPDAAAVEGMDATTCAADPGAMRGVLERLRHGDAVTGLLDGRRRDGSAIAIRYAGRAVLDEPGSPVAYELVTEDVTAERAAREDVDRFAATMEAAELAIVNQTTTGEILGWNGAAQRLYGWPPETRGRTVYDVSPPEEWDEIRASTARVAAGEIHGPLEIRRIYRDRLVHLSITVVPVRDASGQITGIASIGRDITSEVMLREERARLEQELRDAQQLEAIGRLAGGIAHDFNNLLARIQGSTTELARDLPAGSTAREAAAEVQRSAGRAAQLTHQLLAFARQEVLRPEVVNLDVVVAEQLPALRRIAGDAVTLVVDPSPATALVSADRALLGEVLAHLVRNAAEAMPDGGTLRVTSRVEEAGAGLVPLTAGGDSGSSREVMLRVTDTGHGIAPALLPHVFEPYVTTKDASEAAGMGLAMVQGVVRQSGGRIELATGPGGTEVTVRLPFATRLPVPEGPRPDATAGRPDRTCLLLVDDDDVVRAITRRILARAGYEVIEAADAGQAASLAAAEGDRVAALLTDVIMPGMRGPELARLLREQRADLPVLFLSGFAGDDLGMDLAVGHTGFLAKPFLAEDLLTEVGRLVGPVVGIAPTGCGPGGAEAAGEPG